MATLSEATNIYISGGDALSVVQFQAIQGLNG